MSVCDSDRVELETLRVGLTNCFHIFSINGINVSWSCLGLSFTSFAVPVLSLMRTARASFVYSLRRKIPGLRTLPNLCGKSTKVNPFFHALVCWLHAIFRPHRPASCSGCEKTSKVRLLANWSITFSSRVWNKPTRRQRCQFKCPHCAHECIFVWGLVVPLYPFHYASVIAWNAYVCWCAAYASVGGNYTGTTILRQEQQHGGQLHNKTKGKMSDFQGSLRGWEPPISVTVLLVTCHLQLSFRIVSLVSSVAPVGHHPDVHYRSRS